MVRSMSELIDADDLLARDLQNPEFRAEWERLAAARAVAEIVATNRERKGLTQTALARAIGVRQPVIARIESGDHVPTIETLIKIASALDIEIMVGIAPSTRSEPTIAGRPAGATDAEEVTAALGSRLVIAAA
ncbi:MAG TPA: helix-turn-helix transcriptional regulator [Thermomicrobiales bacterium]|nr:helix-turn-helix transcriptional regulator [Thermomicrobiales bacterium]